MLLFMNGYDVFNDNPNICETCALFYKECRCKEEVRITLPHRVTLITTHLEKKIRSNTGRLLELRLENFRTIYLGQQNWENEVIEEKENSQYLPVLMFPNPSSPSPKVIANEAGKPLNIFLFDTSWRTGRRWLSKTVFHSLKKIELKGKYTSRYYLRTNPNENYLCTFQSLTCLLQEINIDFERAAQNLMTTMDYVVKCMAKERNQTYIIDGEIY